MGGLESNHMVRPEPNERMGPHHPAPPLSRLWTMLALALWAPAVWAGPLTLDDVVTGQDLRFLATRPDPDAYWYASTVHIGPESLASGVVTIDTCHHQLDAIHRIVIAFNADRVQALRVQSSTGVEQAEVQGKRVELRGVKQGGSVCVEVVSRALDADGPGRWRLQAGPLMRRYLDGYLPMRAQLQVRWPAGLLNLLSTEPTVQPGVVLEQADGTATLDVTFAGRLRPQFVLNQPASR